MKDSKKAEVRVETHICVSTIASCGIRRDAYMRLYQHQRGNHPSLTAAFLALLLSASLVFSSCKPTKTITTSDNPDIRFGVCTSLSNSDLLKKAGYSYVEGSVQRDLMPGSPDSEFTKKLKEFDTCRLPVIACNSFLPRSLKVTGPDARTDTVLRYAEVAFMRASMKGIHIIVFGSGGARKIPEGFDPLQARTQFIKLLKEMGPVAGKYGISVAIETKTKARYKQQPEK